MVNRKNAKKDNEPDLTSNEPKRGSARLKFKENNNSGNCNTDNDKSDVNQTNHNNDSCINNNNSMLDASELEVDMSENNLLKKSDDNIEFKINDVVWYTIFFFRSVLI